MLIVNWNGAHLLPACLDAVLPQGAPVVVVDNNSADESLSVLAGYPGVRVIRSTGNSGFSGGIAQAMPMVDTPYVVLLNNDAEVAPGWLAALLAPFEDSAVAGVGSRLLLPDGRFNSAGGYAEPNGYAHDLGFGDPNDGRYAEPADRLFACGAAAAFRTEDVAKVGGFDPRFFLYYEDVDLCWRLWLAGRRVVYAPEAVAVHQHSASTGEGSLLHTFQTERNRLATLVRCGTAELAWRAVIRYPLTTVSVAIGESPAKARRRVAAYVSFLGWLPQLLRARRKIAQRVGVDRIDDRRRAVQQRFLSGTG